MQDFYNEHEQAKIYTIRLYIESAVKNPQVFNVLGKDKHQAARCAIAQQKRLYPQGTQIVAQDIIETNISVQYISSDICENVYKSEPAKQFWMKVFDKNENTKPNRSHREAIPFNSDFNGVQF